MPSISSSTTPRRRRGLHRRGARAGDDEPDPEYEEQQADDQQAVGCAHTSRGMVHRDRPDGGPGRSWGRPGLKIRLDRQAAYAQRLVTISSRLALKALTHSSIAGKPERAWPGSRTRRVTRATVNRSRSCLSDSCCSRVARNRRPRLRDHRLVERAGERLVDVADTAGPVLPHRRRAPPFEVHAAHARCCWRGWRAPNVRPTSLTMKNGRLQLPDPDTPPRHKRRCCCRLVSVC